MKKSNLDLIRLILEQDKSVALELKESVLEKLSDGRKQSGYGPLLTQNETAKYLNVSRSTVFRMCRDGQLTPSDVRGLKRYRREDLEKIAGGRK